MNKLLYALSIVSVMALFSCKNESKEEKAVTKTENSVIVSQLNAIEDSCGKAWTMMMDSDDQKIKDIQRLVQELSYIPGHDEHKVDELTKEAKALTSVRYKQETLTSDNIDAYDKATDDLLKAVFDLKRNTKGVEQYVLTEELEASIREADGKVVNYRVLYDTWAKQYNEKLAANEGLQSAFKKKNSFQY